VRSDRRALSGGLLKDRMSIHWLEQVESDVPAEDYWLGPNERACLERMRFLKRRTDWRLGRWTAKRAVAARLNLPADPPALANIEIRAAQSGAPEVFLDRQPAHIAISLSHRAGVALCAVGAPDASFGCDLETVERRDAAFLADYFTSEEQEFVARSPVEEQQQLAAVLWSAKESTLKALRQGLRLSTTSVSVSLVEAPPDSSVPIRQGRRPASGAVVNADGWRTLRACYTGEHDFRGWWRQENHIVRTIVSAIAPSQAH